MQKGSCVLKPGSNFRKHFFGSRPLAFRNCLKAYELVQTLAQGTLRAQDVAPTCKKMAVTVGEAERVMRIFESGVSLDARLAVFGVKLSNTLPIQAYFRCVSGVQVQGADMSGPGHCSHEDGYLLWHVSGITKMDIGGRYVPKSGEAGRTVPIAAESTGDVTSAVLMPGMVVGVGPRQVHRISAVDAENLMLAFPVEPVE